MSVVAATAGMRWFVRLAVCDFVVRPLIGPSVRMVPATTEQRMQGQGCDEDVGNDATHEKLPGRTYRTNYGKYR
jgi:hypothetical protein